MIMFGWPEHECEEECESRCEGCAGVVCTWDSGVKRIDGLYFCAECVLKLDGEGVKSAP